MEVYVLIGHHFILPLFHPPIVFYLLTFPPLKDKLIGYEPSVYVACNTWNVGQWYWAT